MHRIIVIGNVNHDRIWRLDDPLVAGSRLRYSSRDIILGGGGFHTGSALLELGADVALVASLKQDDLGINALKALRDMGFDVSQIAALPGETIPLEILLEPNGERTIIGPPRAGTEPLSVAEPPFGAAAYINALSLARPLLAAIDELPLVVSQLPLRPADPRPADYIITSRADVGEDIGAVWKKALALSGTRLKTLVMTDGPRPVTLYDGQTAVDISIPPAVRTHSTIGAGDRFCGAFLFALLEGADAVKATELASRSATSWLSRQHQTAG